MSMLLTEAMLHKKTPQELTSLLYEACLNNLEISKKAINEKDYALANEKLIKAYDIIYRLDGGINYESGGIISDQLDSVYDYVSQKILEANLNKAVAPIEESIKLIAMIAEAWNTVLRGVGVRKQPTPRMNKTAQYDKFSAYDR